jgi:hypothetical protein
MNRPVTPESVLSNDDPGDDTQRRFRYQATYAAIVALSLLDEKSEADYIFCEHHEDILVKHKDGTFVGIQVKTRIVHKGPYKAGDEAIIKSLKRFIKLESQFREYFSKYVIAVNNGFWQETENSSNLPYLLRLAKVSISKEGVTSEKCLSDLAKKLCSSDETIKPLVLNPDGTINNFALKVLSKVRTEDDLPGLNDVETRLLEVLLQFPEIRHRRGEQVQQIAQKLVHEMFRAASLANNSPQFLYSYLLTNSGEQKTNAIVQGKRITQEKILQILQIHSSTKGLYQKNSVDVPTLSSEREVDYTRLRDLLAAGEWKEADKETLLVMLQAAGREQELAVEDIKKFPCTDLRTIDRLWVKYSDCRFGFSIQKRIWEKCVWERVSVTPKAGYETYRRFSDCVGWRVKEAWLNYDELTFDTTNAPQGHLPSGFVGFGWRFGSSLALRLLECNL